MAIQIRRGTDANWEANKSNIVDGEPAITTDSERFFVGTGAGTFAEFANIVDVNSIDSRVDALEALNTVETVTLTAGANLTMNTSRAMKVGHVVYVHFRVTATAAISSATSATMATVSTNNNTLLAGMYIKSDSSNAFQASYAVGMSGQSIRESGNSTIQSGDRLMFLLIYYTED